MDECKPLLSDKVLRVRRAVRAAAGGAVQVDPIKPTLKALGLRPLKVKYNDLLSKFAFKYNLRRYNWHLGAEHLSVGEYDDAGKAGAYTRPILSST